MSPNPLQISQLGSSTKLIADDADLIPIQQPNGITRRTSKIGLITPSVIKTTAENTDYFIGIDSTGSLYKISKTDLLAGLSSGGGTSQNSVGTTVYVNNFDNGLAALTTVNSGATINSTSGKWNNTSLSLVNSGVTVTGSGAFSSFGTDDIAIETWVNIPNSGYHTIASKWAASGGDITGFYQLGIDGGKAVFYWGNYSGNYPMVQSDIVLSINTWHYIGLSRVGDIFKLYVNSATAEKTFTNTSKGTNTSFLFDIGHQNGVQLSTFKMGGIRFTKPYTGTIAIPSTVFYNG